MGKKKEKYVTEKVSLRQCLRIFQGVDMPWGMMAAALILTVVGAFAGLRVATFSGDMVDASGDLPTAELVKFVLATVIQVALSTAALVIQGLASEKINRGLRKKLWSKIIYTKQNVYGKDGGETLVSRVTTDCDFACNFFVNIVSLASLTATMIMYLTQLYAVNVSMANYALIFIPVSILVGGGYTVLRFIVAQKVQAMLAESTAYLVERTKDMPLIKTANAQHMEEEEGKKRFLEQYKIQVKVGWVTALQQAIDQFLSILAIAIPFVVGAGFVSSGILTVGAVVTFNGLFGNVKTSFSNLILTAGNLKEANGALARVTKVFDLEQEYPDAGENLSAEESKDVVLEDITFGYSSDRTILKEFSCRIPRGKVTAVVGTNGSGKTTMFRLIERLYEPQAGKICFGEKEISNYSLHSWRKKFCMIGQGSPMMEGTIRENICYGYDREISEEELVEVAKLSHVYDFVKDLPEGFDSYVAPGGGNFSGGQKQCIAIARAMVNPGEYLLLDEVTSNLDVKREKQVMEAMTELMKGRTTVIIAHSLAAIRNADYVLVLHDGVLESADEPKRILEQTGNYLTKMMERGN